MRTVATQAELEEALAEYADLLRRHIRVEAMILFGSYVNGSPDEWSDIDVAVISPDFEDSPIMQRQKRLAGVPLEHDLRISPIGYPSSEYHNPGRHSFLREIIRTGKVVYTAE